MARKGPRKADLIIRRAHKDMRNRWDTGLIDWLIDWLIDYLLFYVPLKNFSLILRRHQCRWRAVKFWPLVGAEGTRMDWLRNIVSIHFPYNGCQPYLGQTVLIVFPNLHNIYFVDNYWNSHSRSQYVFLFPFSIACTLNRFLKDDRVESFRFLKNTTQRYGNIKNALTPVQILY
jgi:hypothetical protein